ncbi:MAG: type II CAAX endopeptidase family protein [Clostridium sp.]|uniref:CPBP family intramembrane glutamic endopeptidase n=1 Tax=Clostridium sp. TaxID=1506 RepID=UPI002FC6AC71
MRKISKFLDAIKFLFKVAVLYIGSNIIGLIFCVLIKEKNIATFFQTIFVLIFIILSLKYHYRDNWSGLLKRFSVNKISFKIVILILIFFILTSIVSTSVSINIVKIFNIYIPNLNTTLLDVTMLGVIIDSIIIPIIEEIIFRGLIFSKLLRSYNIKIALIAQAFIFGILHSNTEQKIYTFILGISFGIIYIYTKSLLAPIIMHSLNNMMVYLCQGKDILMNTRLEQIITLIFVIPYIIIIVKIIKKHRT